MCMPPVTRSGVPLPSRSPAASVMRCVGALRHAVHRELLAAVVLQPDEAQRRRIAPRVVGADHRHVEVAVAVGVDRHRARRARQIADAVQRERVRALIFEPLHAVPRPAVGRRVVEGVAVAVQEVGVAVAIEIDRREPARSEVGVRRSPHEPRREPAAAGIGEHPDLFPLLADERGDVERAAAVEIGDDHVDRARQLLQYVRGITPLAAILEPQRLPVVVAEARRPRDPDRRRRRDRRRARRRRAAAPRPRRGARTGRRRRSRGRPPIRSVGCWERARRGRRRAGPGRRRRRGRSARHGRARERRRSTCSVYTPFGSLPEPGELPASRVADEDVRQAVRRRDRRPRRSQSAAARGRPVARRSARVSRSLMERPQAGSRSVRTDRRPGDGPHAKKRINTFQGGPTPAARKTRPTLPRTKFESDALSWSSWPKRGWLRSAWPPRRMVRTRQSD